MDLTRTYRLVLPTDANHHGTLYAGSLLRLTLEAAYATAWRHVGNEANLVLRRVLNLECLRPVPVGTVIEIEGTVLHRTQVYLVAGQTLKQIGPAAEKAVWPLLKHNDLFVRHEACKVLGDIGTQQSLVLLGQAAGDQNGLVRMAAQNALRAVQQRKQ